MCLVKTNVFELSYLQRYKTTTPVWESPEKSTPTGKSSLGLVFHLKMLVFIKISNTNKVFPNQTLPANTSCFCGILFISAAQAS